MIPPDGNPILPDGNPILPDGNPILPDGNPILPDGSYDVIVVETSDEDDADQVHLALTILSGDHRSEVVEVAVSHLGRDAFDLLGLPGTLTVADGTPHLSIED